MAAETLSTVLYCRELRGCCSRREAPAPKYTPSSSANVYSWLHGQRKILWRKVLWSDTHLLWSQCWEVQRNTIQTLALESRFYGQIRICFGHDAKRYRGMLYQLLGMVVVAVVAVVNMWTTDRKIMCLNPGPDKLLVGPWARPLTAQLYEHSA